MRERQAYNMEVQILSGIAKYIGFPAAPEVKGVASSELQQDLEAMGVSRLVLLSMQPYALHFADKSSIRR